MSTKISPKLSVKNPVKAQLPPPVMNAGVGGVMSNISFSRNELSPGVFQFKIFDDVGNMVDCLHHGQISAGSGVRSVNFEAFNANLHYSHTNTYADNGGVGISTTRGTASLGVQTRLWNAVDTADAVVYYSHANNPASPRVPSLASGEAVEVGADYIRFFDAATDEDIFIIQHNELTSADETSTLPYTLDSAPQGVAATPRSNTTHCVTMTADTLTTTSIRTRESYPNLSSLTGGDGSGFATTYWAKSSYDGDIIKTGSSGSERWVEFYEDGVLVAMCQFGITAAGHVIIHSYPKSLPTGEGGNVRIRTTSDRGDYLMSNVYVLNDADFTVQNRLRSSAGTQYTNYVAWWFKEP